MNTLPETQRSPDNKKGLAITHAQHVAYYVLLCILISHLLVVALICATPPISRDALIHHLAIPKLWLKNGGFYEIPWAEYSYYPMNIELLYLIPLYFKNDIAPKFIHFAFGLATGLLIYSYLRQRLGRAWGLLGGTIFLTTPIVAWLSSSAYVDLGMTFFTTGGIFGFVKWRDSGYNRPRWLAISACCMGMALGSKYNTLIGLLFINLMVTYAYARDTQRQLPAVKYGALFFLIASLVASPWYVKNYVLTGDPFYPLFESFFRALHAGAGAGRGLDAIVQDSGISFFRMREIMYGETFWETLLIPIRMFFQGSDNSYQYFQGVLNPILIVFLPFAVVKKDYREETILFAAFCFFFITVAYFMTAKQVRYLLPVIPFLSIIAVMGIKYVSDSLLPEEQHSDLNGRSQSDGTHNILMSGVRIALFVVVGILLSLNASYLKDRFENIRPLGYIFGSETRDAFLERHLYSYPAIRYINDSLPTDARVLLVFLGRRGYYLDRSYISDRTFGASTINGMVKAAGSETEFRNYLESLKFTHILMRTDLFWKYLNDNFSQDAIARLASRMGESLGLLYEVNGYAVYSVGRLRP